MFEEEEIKHPDAARPLTTAEHSAVANYGWLGPIQLQMEMPGIASRYSIRTSDRRFFRRCQRKWALYSSLRMNLQRRGTEQNINFWFGTAIHFALEDYHGYNRFGDPRRAFMAYYKAFKPEELPEGAAVAYEMGLSMLEYYLEWYPAKNEQYGFETAYFNEENKLCSPDTPGARPGVEIQFYLNLDIYAVVDKRTGHIYCEFDPNDTKLSFSTDSITGEVSYWYEVDGHPVAVELMPIHYHGTVDRIVRDKLGRMWILDYKTAKGADTNKLDTDDQISAYLWAMEQYLGIQFYGFIYLQLTKAFITAPKRVKGGVLSSDKRQKTTHKLYREAIIADYGDVKNAPNSIIETLNALAEKETPEGDRFIRWDLVTRNYHQKVATYYHIMGELHQMLDPKLYCYPSPTRDCIWDCSMRDICLQIDRGEVTEAWASLNLNYEQRPRKEDNLGEKWEDNIVWPEEPIIGLAKPSELEMSFKEFEGLIDLENMDLSEIDIDSKEIYEAYE